MWIRAISRDNPFPHNGDKALKRFISFTHQYKINPTRNENMKFSALSSESMLHLSDALHRASKPKILLSEKLNSVITDLNNFTQNLVPE